MLRASLPLATAPEKPTDLFAVADERDN